MFHRQRMLCRELCWIFFGFDILDRWLESYPIPPVKVFTMKFEAGLFARLKIDSCLESRQ